MFDLTTDASLILTFAEGVISFFSPCILPILPLYFSYLGGNAKTVKADGTIEYQKRKVFLYTVSFVLGITTAFFLLGLSVFALGRFFEEQKFLLIRIGGLLIIGMGFIQMGLFHIPFFAKEWRLPFGMNGKSMNFILAFVMGFTFSFAWTPCVGPALSSVLIMAGNADTVMLSFLYIGTYALGFVVPFLIVALFTATVLQLIKKYQSSLRMLIRIGGVMLVVIGFMMFAGAFHEDDVQRMTNASQVNEEKAEAVDFQLRDLDGREARLSDYRGKTIYLNFWATWCPYCRKGISDLNELYEEYGKNQEDVIIISVIVPGGRDADEEGIRDFAEENDIRYPVLLDEESFVFASYAVHSLPTVYMINRDFRIQGYVSGGMDKDAMKSIIEQTADD
ncbi:MAG: redoxin domain-containing protein [Erysipelotrichaceae bacterium]|jgi:cytochrome c-type biogenesis protein|nr:redoxin domain-containing protein [Erysipelotrichaceae bacterium]